MPSRSEMQSEYKEKLNKKTLKVSFKAIFNVPFANLVSKEYFSIQRMNNELAK